MEMCGLSPNFPRVIMELWEEGYIPKTPKKLENLGGGNSNIFYFHPYLGKIPILTNIFQKG